MAHPFGAASLALLAALALLPAASHAQVPTTRTSRGDTVDAPAFRFRAEAGLAAATPLARDENGLSVGTGVSPMAGIGVARALESGVTVAAGVRAALLSLRFSSEDGSSWSDGTAGQVDATVAAERDVGWCRTSEAAGCTAARAGAAVVFLAGPRDVVPFRQTGSRWGVGAEFGGSVRLPTGMPFYATVLGQAYHMFGDEAPLAGPVRAGVVARLLAGVRYGR